MRPLYDKRGGVIAFLGENNRIVDLRGRSIAWIRDDNVYNYNGRHLGWWLRDHMRGPDGGVMVWLRGASPGVMLPIPRLPPMPPLPELEPLRPLPNLPPLRPMRSLSWSAHSLT